jgi:four helix bundle protein
MKGEDIQDRTKGFAMRILNMAVEMPKTYLSQIISDQIIRSATLVGANYRSACRSKSRREFVNKLKIVEEELDQTNYWLELIEESNIFSSDRISQLTHEGNELLSIILTSIQTARRNDKE